MIAIAIPKAGAAMPTMVLDETLAESILAERRAKGDRTGEEVWDGVTYIMPQPNNEHQDLAYLFGLYFGLAVYLAGKRGRPQNTSNISDRIEGWNENFRNPDFVYFSPDTVADDQGTFWCGGPDFLLEIISPGDMSRDKLPFYARIGTRDPWQFELYRLQDGEMELVGMAEPGDGVSLNSEVVPLTFALKGGLPRPLIHVAQLETGQEWTF
jgi:Uma2 family endonuclease